MEISDTYLGFAVVLCSACGFQLLNKIVDSQLTPSHLSNKPSAKWKLKNIFISFIHSILSGFWAVYSFYHHPPLAEDLISTYTHVALYLVAMSVGYFIYDTVDMLVNNRTKQTYELIVHHSVILVCFGIALTTHKFIGYATVALIVELNSIFLHGRQLMQMLGLQKDSSLYRFNSLVNLGTFIVFRIATLSWMTRWIVLNRQIIPLVLYTIGSLGLAIMTIMNIILFVRLLWSDFIRSKKEKECSTKED